MTKEELAAKINGREYGQELFPAEEQAARTAGLVVVFGASDDLMEFRGAIHDELGAGSEEGKDAFIVNGDIWSGPDCEDRFEGGRGCKYAQAADVAAKARGQKITAYWDRDGYSWVIEALTIPHAIFDIVEGDEKFCRGIVFDLKDY